MGFPNRKVFNKELKYLNPGFEGDIKLICSNYMEETKGQVKRDRLLVENQIFLYLCRVKVGLFEQDLSNISISTVSTLIISWSNFVYQRLSLLKIWSSKEPVIEHSKRIIESNTTLREGRGNPFRSRVSKICNPRRGLPSRGCCKS